MWAKRKKKETIQQKKYSSPIPSGCRPSCPPSPRLNGLGYHSRVVSSDRDHECIAIFIFMSSGSLLNRWSANLTRVNVCFCQAFSARVTLNLFWCKKEIYSPCPLSFIGRIVSFGFAQLRFGLPSNLRMGIKGSFCQFCFPVLVSHAEKEKLREKEIPRL